MRIISDALSADIDDAVNTGILGNLPPAVAEKSFELRLKPLVFAAEKPEFQTCFTAFQAIARRMLERLSPLA